MLKYNKTNITDEKMIKTDIKLPINYTKADICDAVLQKLPVERSEIREIRFEKRTLNISDKSNIHYDAQVSLSFSAEREAGLLKMRKQVAKSPDYTLEIPASNMKSRPVVIGAGPAGLACALILAEAGARPILYERGLSVEERSKKVKAFNTLGILDTECNIQYGEGGAGTYSDGKLKVGARDKYKHKVLCEFVECGAPEDIIYSVGAHVGTDKLTDIVKGLRNKIISLGGEVNFDSRLVDIKIKDGAVVGGRVEVGRERRAVDFETDTLILATGHSARDSFELLKKSGALLEARGFGIGLRIEHPREYINELVYGKNAPDGLGTASYHLVTHLPSGRSVYSFCMCPGGSVVAAASESGGIVTNGMSEYLRDGDNSNAALLVSVTPADFESDDALAGLELQRKIENAAFRLAGGDYKAPSQRLDDFKNNKVTQNFGSVKPSYPRDVVSTVAEDYLPEYITNSLRAAMPEFDAWMPGYDYPDAVLTGPETRTTSPVRVLRAENTYEAVGIRGLYPIGEGAGYAGGIISSARDGVMVAEAILKKYE